MCYAKTDGYKVSDCVAMIDASEKAGKHLFVVKTKPL
jgi:hypothetical protein